MIRSPQIPLMRAVWTAASLTMVAAICGTAFLIGDAQARSSHSLSPKEKKAKQIKKAMKKLPQFDAMCSGYESDNVTPNGFGPWDPKLNIYDTRIISFSRSKPNVYWTDSERNYDGPGAPTPRGRYKAVRVTNTKTETSWNVTFVSGPAKGWHGVGTLAYKSMVFMDLSNGTNNTSCVL